LLSLNSVVVCPKQQNRDSMTIAMCGIFEQININSVYKFFTQCLWPLPNIMCHAAPAT